MIQAGVQVPRCRRRRRRGRGRAGLLVLAVAVVSGCTASLGIRSPSTGTSYPPSTRRSGPSQPAAGGSPSISSEGTGQLIYLLGGPDTASGDVYAWRPGATHPARLTTSPRHFGITWITASKDRILVSDSQANKDQLAYLDGTHLDVLPRKIHRITPDLAASGDLAYAAITFVHDKPHFSVRIERAGDTRARVLVDQRQDLASPAWGPGEAHLAYLSPSGRPDPGVTQYVVVITAQGRQVRRIRPIITNPTAVLWSEHSTWLIVSNYHGRSEFIQATTGRQRPIAAGWDGVCFLPGGTHALVSRHGVLGSVTPNAPTGVKTLGHYSGGRVFGCAYLKA